jgi:hypothetical protein
MFFVATLVSQSASIIGLMAGAIGVGGFLGHARPALAGWTEAEVRRAMVVGGLWGVAGVAVIIVLSAIGIG